MADESLNPTDTSIPAPSGTAQASPLDALHATDRLLDEMIRYQRARVLKHAQALRPDLSEDDLMQPHDYPALMADPGFHFEDGQVAGLVAFQVAFRARVLGPAQRGE